MESSSAGTVIALLLRGAWRRAPPALTGTVLPRRELLIAGGIAGLAWHKLQASGLEEHPEAAGLADLHRLQVLQEAERRHWAARVARRFRRARLTPLFAKGWVAARHYGARGLRPAGDLDVYVSPGEHAAARAIPEQRIRSQVELDLHRGCADLDDVPFERLRERAAAVRIRSTTVLVPSDEDHLRLLCLHGLRHGLARPLWLCDIAAALEALPASADWDRVLGGARWRRRWVAAALELACRLLDASPPAKVPWDRSLPRWLPTEVLRTWDRAFAPREEMARARGAAEVAVELRKRWPNAIEASVGLRLAPGAAPRIACKLGEGARRTVRFGLLLLGRG